MTATDKVVLTRMERKERLGHGGVSEVAALAGVTPSFVSKVVNGHKRNARIENLIIGRIGRPGEDVFPPHIAPSGVQVKVA